MAEPTDVDLVRSALRLGWYVAEVRGRNRPDAPAVPPPGTPPRADHPLPLRIERSPTERRIEAQQTLAALAVKLGVDTTPDQPGFGSAIDEAAAALWHARKAPGPATDPSDTWLRLASVLWDFDTHVQDHLTANSDTQACGYQLGRGLAECYWALNPDSTGGWDSWSVLYDDARCAELTRLAGRLTEYMNPFASAAIIGSLEVWKVLARDDAWRREPAVSNELHNQIRNWYELITLGQDPSRLVTPYVAIRNWRVIGKAAWIFLPELLLTGVGLAALVTFVVLLSAPHPSHVQETIIGILSALGLSTAGLSSRLKNRTQALSTRFRQDAYTDLVARAITTVPPPPDRRHGRDRDEVVETAVRNRAITPSTPFG